MEFFNIQSSAALIYDEFIQNAGKYHKEKALAMTVACYYYTAYAVSTVCFYDSAITSQLILQTPGRRTGSSCRLHSPKQSSSRRTFTL